MRSVVLFLFSLLSLTALTVRAPAQQHLRLHVVQVHNRVDLSVTGAQARMPILLFVGTKAGHTKVFAGTHGIDPLTIGLARPFVMLVLGVADAHGVFKLSVKTSGKLPAMKLQAVSPATHRVRHRTVVTWRLSSVVSIH